MSETVHPPTRSQIINMLTKLLDGSTTRDEVSRWAGQWAARAEEIDDVRVNDALVWLAGADTPTTDRPYLFMKEDFENWLCELTG